MRIARIGVLASAKIPENRFAVSCGLILYLMPMIRPDTAASVAIEPGAKTAYLSTLVNFNSYVCCGWVE